MSENLNVIMEDTEIQLVKMGIRKSTIGSTKRFPCEKTDIPIEYKIDEMLVIIDKTYQATKAEILGLFELYEAYAIIQSFNGSLYNPNHENKATFLYDMECAFYYEGLDEIFGINKDKLMDKLEKLTEFQCFAVSRMAFEVLYNEKFDSKDTDLEELVKGVFGIK